MKNRLYYILTFVVVFTLSFSLSNSFVGVETAFAQNNKLTKEFSDGGGGSEGCSGGVCNGANGHKYSTLTHQGTTTCCGVVSSISGDKSS